jgi:hypothetical protein
MKILEMMKWAPAVAVLCGASSAVLALPAARGPVDASGAYVKSTTYYFCNGSSHSALDMCVGNPCGACNQYAVKTMIEENRYYNVYTGCAADCDSTTTSCNGGAGNYITTVGNNGYDFRQLHMNTNGNSYSRWANVGEPFGLLGSTGSSTAPHVHADNRKSGTRLTAWYADHGITCGSPASSANIVGYPRLTD